jgi:hypothetical protein
MIVVVPRVIARTLGVKTMRLPTSRRQKQNDVVERTGRSVIPIYRFRSGGTQSRMTAGFRSYVRLLFQTQPGLISPTITVRSHPRTGQNCSKRPPSVQRIWKAPPLCVVARLCLGVWNCSTSDGSRLRARIALRPARHDSARSPRRPRRNDLLFGRARFGQNAVRCSFRTDGPVGSLTRLSRPGCRL